MKKRREFYRVIRVFRVFKVAKDSKDPTGPVRCRYLLWQRNAFFCTLKAAATTITPVAAQVMG